MDDPDAVEMALWFHDVIYETNVSSGVNERSSAEFFMQVATPSLRHGFCEQVFQLIMVTTHSRTPSTIDEMFVVDIDLSSFGLPWKEFATDSVSVRDEFPQFTDEDFYPKQRVFMQALLARPRFCFTQFFHSKHEQTARANIKRHLAKLSERGFR